MIFGVISIVVSFIAVVFTALLWREARRSAEFSDRSAGAAEQSVSAARETLQIQRAWLLFSGVEYLLRTPTQAPVSTALHFKNVGSTPAIDVSSAVKWIVGTVPPDLSDDSDVNSAAKEPHGSLGPQQGMRLMVGFPSSQSDQAASGDQHIFVWGKLSYTDVFRRIHHTHFSLRYSRDLQDFKATDFGNSID